MEKSKTISLAGVSGFLAGASIGYFYRPSAFLIGQLPFKHVITRGTDLQGMDQIYIAVAEKSFNYLLAGGIIGATAGIVAVLLLHKGKAKA